MFFILEKLFYWDFQHIFVLRITVWFNYSVILKTPKKMIKKITPLIACICLTFNSCTTDIVVNDPGLQATIDGKLFRPDIRKAIIHDDGTLVIIGNSGAESISFSTASTEVGTYRFSQQNINEASFENSNMKFISETGTSNGQITITEIHDNLISGTFYFENLKGSNGTTMSFQNGWFYRLPIENFVEETNDDGTAINPCLLNASLTATVDGNELITDDHDAIPFGVNNPSILIKASNETEEVTIIFPVNVTVGTHSLTGSGDYSATYAINNDKSSAITGTLTITSHDTESKCITGSFEFTTASGVVVTEGVFDYGY